MNGESDYSRYLRGRSWLGGIYRSCVLYPRLGSYLSGRVLDYGCGIGDFLRYRPGATGVDVNRFNVDYCKSIGLDALPITSGDKLPFADGCFGGIVMDNVLEHIPLESVGPVVAELRRVLAHEGRLVVGVPGEKGYSSDPDHKVFYDRQRMECLFGEQGFVVEGWFHMPLGWAGLGRYLRSHCLYIVLRLGPDSSGGPAIGR